MKKYRVDSIYTDEFTEEDLVDLERIRANNLARPTIGCKRLPMRNKIGVFIPSYNRPMQLHALLESITLHDKANLLANIHVRYQGTTTALANGYVHVKNNEAFRHIDFKNKSPNGLGYDMLEVMGNSSYKYFVVITDDSLFYRDFTLPYEELDRAMTDDINHLSFRLGYNTEVIDYTNPIEKHFLKINNQFFPNLLQFNWTNHTNHYGYPCALDGTLFNRVDILNYTLQSVGASFDYRKWECKVNELICQPLSKPYALCFEQSVLVNSPNNMVSDGPYCKNGEVHKYTVEELNSKYLAGEKIDIRAIDSDSIVSVQQELPLKFIKNDAITSFCGGS
jgi:hypothetical protein